MNKMAKKFEIELYELINNCGLPISTAYYIVKSTYLDLEKNFENYLKENSKDESEETQKIEIPVEQEAHN